MTTTEIDERFVFVDIETTGLNYMVDYVLEVGLVITDSEFETIDIYDAQIWESPSYDIGWENVDPYVQTMHHGNGLLEECRSSGQTVLEAERQLFEWLDGHGVSGVPMTGSSVHFDRSFLTENMPTLTSRFSHRNIDVSSIKELCMRLNPDLYAKLDSVTKKREKHRAIEDIEDTIGELKFYRDNFLLY